MGVGSYQKRGEVDVVSAYHHVDERTKQRAIDLHEKGLSTKVIAMRTGLAQKYVQKLIAKHRQEKSEKGESVG